MGCDIGNRIIMNFERTPRELVEAYDGIPSSNIGDMMNRLSCMRSYLNRIGRHDIHMHGTAFTVKVPDGDNVFLHKALDLAQPGDVIIVDGNGCTSRSLCGEIMFTYAQQRGIAGLVVDGAIRDSDALDHLELPVYAAAITPQGPYKNGPGEINVPVSCGGQVMFPGDLIVGDADGVCVIRRDDAEMILKLVREKFDGEQVTLENYRKGILDREKHSATYDAILNTLNTTIRE